jgi:glycosyltransferase involved in cell wall biosynthesis
VRIAILQRVCTSYRIPLFSGIASSQGSEVVIFIGDDVPESKVKNAADLAQLPVHRMKTYFLRLGRRHLPWHVGLIGQLRRYKPDVILCEAESHFVGYVQAILYRALFNRRAALIHWCYISLPGWKVVGGTGPRALIKRFFRSFFDAFVVYSSFSRDCLARLRIPREKVFVATNVCDTSRFMKQADDLRASPTQAKAKLGLGTAFTVLYVGELDWNKRPEVLLDLAGQTDRNKFAFVLLGSGVAQEELRVRARSQHLDNVFIPGRVTEGLQLYFRAADAVVIPGRGGIIISEAMAHGLPVVVHQADGTEHDLVRNGETGMLLANGTVDDFREAIEFLIAHPEVAEEMGRKGRALIENRFNTQNMVDQILKAATYACESRRGCISPQA